MEILQFIPDHILILIPSTYILGICLKVSNLKDNYIPMTLFVFSIVYSVILGRAIGIDIPNGILHGILAWGCSIGINQTLKQMRGEV